MCDTWITHLSGTGEIWLDAWRELGGEEHRRLVLFNLTLEWAKSRRIVLRLPERDYKMREQVLKDHSLSFRFWQGREDSTCVQGTRQCTPFSLRDEARVLPGRDYPRHPACFLITMGYCLVPAVIPGVGDKLPISLQFDLSLLIFEPFQASALEIVRQIFNHQLQKWLELTLTLFFAHTLLSDPTLVFRHSFRRSLKWIIANLMMRWSSGLKWPAMSSSALINPPHDDLAAMGTERPKSKKQQKSAPEQEDSEMLRCFGQTTSKDKILDYGGTAAYI
ncbi:hypothetical protein C8R44DRAFT_735626 [Mycena epipterygia]|nr:hypothetical protein C8R44DRAFT_735626 [Mycena epipterygia]